MWAIAQFSLLKMRESAFYMLMIVAAVICLFTNSADPVSYWHLTLWPGLAIFLAVCAFNFAGEGLRKAVSPE